LRCSKKAAIYRAASGFCQGRYESISRRGSRGFVVKQQKEETGPANKNDRGSSVYGAEMGLACNKPPWMVALSPHERNQACSRTASEGRQGFAAGVH